MSRRSTLLPATALVSFAAALTTWLTLLAWAPFHEQSSTYLVPLLGVCLFVAACGTMLRLTRLPALAVAVVQVVLLALWLHHRWTEGGAFGGWLPTAESLQVLDAQFAAAMEAARAYAAPIPRDVTPFALLMVTAGACAAVLVDFIACGLRRAPIAGLPLLAVYTAPVSILDGGVSWLKFAAAALAFLGLIAAQEAIRLSHWGQQVSGSGRLFDSQATQVNGKAVWTSARKIGLTATGLSVLVPILVPTFSLGLFDGPGAGSGGNGDSVSLTNPILNMRRDLLRGADIDLVEVHTNDPDPSYLRTSVLDQFDGDRWEPSRRSIPPEQQAEGAIPAPPGLGSDVARERYDWQVGVSDAFDSLWLPVPYPAAQVEAPGDWRYDVDTLDFVTGVRDETAAGLSYDLERLDVDPTAEQLAAARPAPATLFGPNTELPDVIPDRVRELARTVTAGQPNRFEMAKALQQWFRVDGGFDYSLERADAGNGIAQLEEFLFDGRVGYCEQFAAAMAVMGRAVGIPSRIAVGFLRAERSGDNTFVFSSHDLHAWPEMYFEGVGWTRFEPTPAIRSGSVPDYTRDRLPGSDPSASESDDPVQRSQDRFPQRQPSQDVIGAAGDGSGPDVRALLTGLAVALGLAVLALLPRAVRAWVRRRRWDVATTPAGLAETAWSELRDSAVDLGVAWDDDVTVRTRARDLARSFGAPDGDADAVGRPAGRGPESNPEAMDALGRLVELVERARYARALPADAAEVRQVRSDVALCGSALAAGARRGQVVKGRWLPASLWSRWNTAELRRRRARTMLDEPGVDHAV